MRNRMLVSVMMIGLVSAAGSAQAEVLVKLQVRGQQVTTRFFASTTITCANGGPGTFSAEGALVGAQSIVKVKGIRRESSNSINVEVSYSNTCTGVSETASGVLEGGFAPPNNNLMSATLANSGVLENGGLPLSLSVNVVGQGPLMKWHSVNHSRTVEGTDGPFIASRSQSSNASRTGTATGTITVAGITLTPTFFDTMLLRDGLGQLVLEK